jgi:hypothetical protein
MMRALHGGGWAVVVDHSTGFILIRQLVGKRAPGKGCSMTTPNTLAARWGKRIEAARDRAADVRFDIGHAAVLLEMLGDHIGTPHACPDTLDRVSGAAGHAARKRPCRCAGGYRDRHH